LKWRGARSSASSSSKSPASTSGAAPGGEEEGADEDDAEDDAPGPGSVIGSRGCAGPVGIDAARFRAYAVNTALRPTPTAHP